MDARQQEEQLVARCCAVASGDATAPVDEREANVFRIVATILGPQHIAEADRLLTASSTWFVAHNIEALPAAEVVRRGWIASLPRMRQLVSQALTR
jgi:hypothetical protein